MTSFSFIVSIFLICQLFTESYCFVVKDFHRNALLKTVQLNNQQLNCKRLFSVTDYDCAKRTDFKSNVAIRYQTLKDKIKDNWKKNILIIQKLIKRARLPLAVALLIFSFGLKRGARAATGPQNDNIATINRIDSRNDIVNKYIKDMKLEEIGQSSTRLSQLQNVGNNVIHSITSKGSSQQLPSKNINIIAHNHENTLKSHSQVKMTKNNANEVSKKVTPQKSKKNKKVDEVVVVEEKIDVVNEVSNLWKDLVKSIYGAKQDTLILLIATSTVIPLFKKINTSPILGFLITGTILGPCGLSWVTDVHMIDALGELGIVFFLFEMGLELSLTKLISMRRDVFGLGTSQYILTSLAGAAVALASGLSAPAAVTIGGSLALSSSAFVLQLLKDKGAMGTRHGRASFGILLLQDIAVVPLLVVVELLASGGSGIGRALAVAGAKAAVALSAMSYIGRRVLDKVFYIVAKSGSHEAFLSVILASVLLMSFVTQGIGLSNTLGAFLAGLLISETRYCKQVEADISPFRGLLLGVFFLTVGFSIDLKLLIKEGPLILKLLSLLIVGKAGIITALCMAFGIPFISAQQCGLLNAQGGEFAFVAFGLAERLGLFPSKLSKVLMTTVALSMAVTPLLASLGNRIARRVEQSAGFTFYVGEDSEAKGMHDSLSNYVFVCGYGRVGKMVCDMLDRMLMPYVAVDASPQKVIEARNRGLSVFFGDVSRPEILRKFEVGSAKACVVAIGDMSGTNKAVTALRENYPNLPLLVRAKDKAHQARLKAKFENIQVICPVLPDDSVLLTLPFGGAVLQTIGVSKPEVDAIMEEFKDQYMKECYDDSCSFLEVLNTRLPENEKYTRGMNLDGEEVVEPSEAARRAEVDVDVEAEVEIEMKLRSVTSSASTSTLISSIVEEVNEDDELASFSSNLLIDAMDSLIASGEEDNEVYITSEEEDALVSNLAGEEDV